MKLSRILGIYINGFFPFLYPLAHIFKNFNFFRGIVAYIGDYLHYKSKERGVDSKFPLLFSNTYPILFDRYEEAGEIPKHYFHMDLWAARLIYKSGVRVHYDIGSRIDSFISHCLVFTKVIMIDVRPLKAKISGLEFIQANGMNMKNIRTSSILSLSALHAVEHFGLGRYGDPIDPLGYKKTIDEMQRIVKKGGHIYFATPIGKQRLEFNAHRVFSPEFITQLFNHCELLEFSAVDDNNVYHEKTKPSKFVNANYSCGMYHFIKK